LARPFCPEAGIERQSNRGLVVAGRRPADTPPRVAGPGEYAGLSLAASTLHDTMTRLSPKNSVPSFAISVVSILYPLASRFRWGESREVLSWSSHVD
jgi:hypothetical protein